MRHKGERVHWGTGTNLSNEVVLRLDETVYTLQPDEAARLASQLTASVKQARDREAMERLLNPDGRDTCCAECCVPLDPEEIVWFDPARARLSTDTGLPYCVLCCPDEEE